MSKYVTGVLPTMISRRSGHIILVNTIQGRLAVPFRSSCELPIHISFGQIHGGGNKEKHIIIIGNHMTGLHLVYITVWTLELLCMEKLDMSQFNFSMCPEILQILRFKTCSHRMVQQLCRAFFCHVKNGTS